MTEITGAERAAREARARAAARRLAWWWGAVATAATGLATFVAWNAFRHDAREALVSAVMFGSLFGGTAAFLGHEVAGSRRCPRCGWQPGRRVARCPDCGYDLATRPRFACPDRHAWSFEPGLCECGQRLQPWTPPDISGRVGRMLWWGAAVLVVLVVTRLILGP